MIQAPHVLLIGSSGRNSGKTTFASALIRKFRDTAPITGAKVTAIAERDGACPRGGEGCGVCTSLEGAYCITEEVIGAGTKDTERMAAAGAWKVYWLRVLKDHLEEGARALLDQAGPNTLMICESNSLRTVLEPGLFFMLHPQSRRGMIPRPLFEDTMKQSASQVCNYVDRHIAFNGKSFDFDLDDISIAAGTWALRYPATAIILAGGASERMGRDKAMLDIDGRPLIQHLFEQLRPHFEQVLISANDPSEYAFLGVDIVPDQIPGKGPLMGILSALEASRHDINFIVACDMPDLYVPLLHTMMRAANNHDAVVPRTHLAVEPLFAIYHKRTAPMIRKAMDAGHYSVREAFKTCDIAYVDVEDSQLPRSLNTQEDYQAFVSREP